MIPKEPYFTMLITVLYLRFNLTHHYATSFMTREIDRCHKQQNKPIQQRKTS